MPVKNAIKIYAENAYYHIYNRGIDKRDIFMEDNDYKVFLHFLKRYLTPPPELPNWRSDLFDKIQLISYCLMPNHFHLMIKQLTKDAISNFMQSLINSYVCYLNKKLNRRGSLFEGRYKAVLIETESQLLHLTRYVHLNPLDFSPLQTDPIKYLLEYPYSSYKDFLGKRQTEWVHPEEILHFFKSAKKTNLKDILSYQSFIEDYVLDPKEVLGELTLD